MFAAVVTVAVLVSLAYLNLNIIESSTGHEPVSRGFFSWLEFNFNPYNDLMRGYELYMYRIHWTRFIAEILLSSVIGVAITSAIWISTVKLFSKKKAVSRA